MTAPAGPNRTFTFGRDSTGCWLQWVDTWYSRLDRRWVSATSQTLSVAGWLGAPQETPFTVTVFDSTGRVVRRDPSKVALWGTGANVVAAGPAGPSRIGAAASLTYTDAKQPSGGGNTLNTLNINTTPATTHHIGSRGVYDVDREAVVSVGTDWTAVEILPGTGWADFIQQPVRITIAGDFRRPKWAHTTAMLTDDELWAVNFVAGSHGLSGPELLAILLELTGARRIAYHPDGFYGISNLSTALLNQWLSGSAGQLGGITTIQDFMSASVYRQLMVTDACLTANLGGQTGVIPVFLLLATGTAPANGLIPAPLPPRLQPLSDDGATLTGDHLAARVATHAALVVDEFTRRLPVLCSPPPGATGLMPGQALYPDQSVQSPDGHFLVTYQGDGNLVLTQSGAGPLWASATAGSTPGRTTMQGDGNLVIYNATNQPVWASHTDTHPGARFAVQDAGFAEVLAPNTTQLWRT